MEDGTLLDANVDLQLVGWDVLCYKEDELEIRSQLSCAKEQLARSSTGQVVR